MEDALNANPSCVDSLFLSESTVFPDLTKLRSLRYLSIRNYTFTSIDAVNVTSLKSLETLEVNYGLLRDFPKNLEHQSLRKLNLSHNMLESAGFSIEGMPSLTSLELFRNPFDDFDLSQVKAFGQLSKLCISIDRELPELMSKEEKEELSKTLEHTALFFSGLPYSPAH